MQADRTHAKKRQSGVSQNMTRSPSSSSFIQGLDILLGEQGRCNLKKLCSAPHERGIEDTTYAKNTGNGLVLERN